jgi:hypothetical protein
MKGFPLMRAVECDLNHLAAQYSIIVWLLLPNLNLDSKDLQRLLPLWE